MHKEAHVAVIIDGWTNIIGKVTCENRPAKFDGFLQEVRKIAAGVPVVFGLEDTRGYGRSLAMYLTGHKLTVKQVNPAYTSAFRLSAPMTFKDDDQDAFCVARVLRDMLDKLPDAGQADVFWTIRQLVNRRDALVKSGVMLQNQLHGQLYPNYPSYKKFFCDIDAKTALWFWENYPSPACLREVTPEQLGEELRKVSHNACSTRKAQDILSLVDADGNTTRDFQRERDYIIKTIVQELRNKKEQISGIDGELEKLIPLTGYKLHTMPGIDLNMASRIISEVGDIERFPNSDKLAKFSGLSPVWFTSAGKGYEQRSKQGNRDLRSTFYLLALQLLQVSPSGKPRHPVFHEYFHRKVKEGKTRPQAMVSVMRRVLRIVYGMMRTKTEYRPFEPSEG